MPPEVRGMLKSNVENEDFEHIKIEGWKFGNFGIVPLSWSHNNAILTEVGNRYLVKQIYLEHFKEASFLRTVKNLFLFRMPF